MKQFHGSIKVSAIVTYVTMALNIVSGIVITPILINVLGLELYGLYSMFGGLILILSYLDLGIGNAATRYTAKYRTNQREFNNYTTNIILFSLVVVLIIFVLSTYVYYNFEIIFSGRLTQKETETASKLFYILSVNLCLTIISNVYLGFCNGCEHFLFPRLLKLINVIVRFVAIYVLVYEYKTIYTVVLIDSFLNLFILIGLLVYVGRNLCGSSMFELSRVDYRKIKKIINFSFWLFVYSTVFSMIWEVGKVISGLLLGSESAALYGIAVMLSGYVSFFSVTVTNMYLPLAIKLVARGADDQEVKKINIYIARVSLITFGYLIIGFILVGKDFILLWLGADFSELYLLTLIMMTSFVLPLTQHFSSHLLEANGYIKYKALSLIFFTFIGFIGLLLSYKYLGLTAFSLMPMLVLQFFQLSQMVIYSKRLKIDIFEFIQKTYLWFTPFILGILIVVYFLDKIQVVSFFDFLIKGVCYSVFFFLILVFYTKNKYTGWFNIKI